MSELVDLRGEPGSFKATVKRHPRYVDESKCNGCSECTQAYPVNIPDRFDRNLGKRKAIAKHYAQATPNIFGILEEQGIWTEKCAACGPAFCTNMAESVRSPGAPREC